jgi:DNA (cytosine-5)-methyltransferase 1
MKVLNLYAGIGGNRKLWTDCEVTAVEWDEETAKVYSDYFPEDEMIIGDAHQYLLDHYKEFDFIWSSPPCPTHSKIRLCGTHKGQNEGVYPDMSLYQEVIFLKYHAKKDTMWIIENVHPYYKPLVTFSKRLDRHLYWCNFKIPGIDIDINYNKVRNSIPMLEDITGIKVSGSGIGNKLKALRNCVHPELGLHIFNAARGIITKSKTTQATLEL